MARAIILEGPDESGKSTLAKALTTITDRPHIEIGAKPITKQQVHSYCRSFVRNAGQDVIMDRCTPISEIIYRAKLGGALVSDLELLAYLQSAVSESYPVFVLCKPKILLPPKVKHLYDDPAQIARIQAAHQDIATAYAELFCIMKRMGFDTFVYDFHSMTPQQLMENIQS